MESTEREFTLPSHIVTKELSDENEFTDGSKEDMRLKNDYAVANARTGRVYVVNESIYLFLSTLEGASLTCRELVKEIAAHTNGSPSEVRDVVLSFLKRMRKQGFVLPTEKADDLPEDVGFEAGDTVGPYRLDDILHDRKWRTVARAHPEEEAPVSEAPVVLKLLRFPPSASEDTYQKLSSRFEHEFDCMAAVADHPNVCDFYHFHVDEHASSSPSYAVIEYVDGVSLRGMIKDETYPLNTRLDVAEQTLAAIAHLHDEEFLHGDIHASNFVVSKDGVVKLIDFGLAKRRNPERNEVVGQGGVTHYIPPERITDDTFKISKKAGTPRSEVFQLGVVLYGLLRGELPFRAALWEDLVQAIREEVPAPLAETPEGEPIPESAKRIVDRALAKDPDDRYASAIDMRNEWKRRVSIEVG